MQDDDHDRLVRIEDAIGALRRELFGNGSPGICNMSRRERENLFLRVGKLEAGQNQQRGILVVVGGIAGAIVSGGVELVASLFRK